MGVTALILSDDQMKDSLARKLRHWVSIEPEVQEAAHQIQNVNRAMAKGALWMILARFSDRALGLISTLFVVRFLTPNDFGIVAMGMSFIAVCELFGQLGLDTALIQNTNATRRHYDTAWTFNVIFAAVTGAATVLVAEPAARYYGEPRLAPIMLCLAAGQLILGFENIGVVAFRKELRFKKEFEFFFYKALTGLVVTVPLAFVLRNYWALIIGIVFERVAGVGLSYYLQEYRPRWSLEARRELFHFSKWMVVFNACNVVNTRGVDFIIGKIAGARALGVFNISYEMSTLPTSELIAPINRAVFPAYAQKSANRGVLRQAYLDVIGMIAVLAVPAGTGIAATANLIVLLVLGEKWVEALPLVPVLAFYGVLTSIKTNTDYVYLALGKPNISAYLRAVQTSLLLPSLILLSMRYGVIGAAYGYLFSQVIFTVISFSVLFRVLSCSIVQLLRVLWRPFTSALLMFVILQLLASEFSPESSNDTVLMMHFLVAVIFGTALYGSSLYTLWIFSGKPIGAESRILDRVRSTRCSLWLDAFRKLVARDRWPITNRISRLPVAAYSYCRNVAQDSVGYYNRRNAPMITHPLLSDVGICALVPDEWEAPWQPRHYVLKNLAHYFHVVWVNPTPDWDRMGRISRSQQLNRVHSIPPLGLDVYEDIWLPRLHRPKWLNHFAFNARLKRARSLLIGHGCREIILYIWRPEFGSALDSVPFDLSCYHIDDEYSFSENEVRIDPVEEEVITKVDQVFIHSVGLMEKKGHINPKTAFVPNGVDFQAYATVVPQPEDLSSVPRPIVGYTGYIKKQLDWPLIRELVKRHCEWSFVFVGPRSPHLEILPVIEELSSFHNVYFLGCKSPRELASYPQHFDACIMPYRVNAYTNNIYPMKLHEYLASGKPVVSSSIRSLRDFSTLISLATGPDEWSKALGQALKPGAISLEAMAARRNIAREYDWQKLANLIAQILCERLGSDYSHQFLEIMNSKMVETV